MTIYDQFNGSIGMIAILQEEIESLHQKLAEKDQTILDHVEIQQALRQQLADHNKREVMLRDAVETAGTQIKKCAYTPARSTLLQALAATEPTK